MVESKVPKDIRTYKTKIIGSLTLRQILILVVVSIVDLLVFKCLIEPLHLPIDALIYIFMFLDLPILAFGWIEPMGLPLEKYLRSVVFSYYLAPVERKDKLMIYEKNYQRKYSEKELKKRKKMIKKSLEESDDYLGYL